MLADHSSLGIRLKEMPFDWKSAPVRLTGKFYYLTFADGVPTVSKFVDYLYDCLIPYCLPKRLYQPLLKKADPAKDFARIVRLGDEAKSLFIAAKNQLDSGGEAGELILYSLLEWALKAPRFVSKMYLKTNNNMPVHGTDGLHLAYDAATDLVTVYFGESKIYKEFSQAADAAFKSISELIANSGQVTREIEILNNLSDLDALPATTQERIVDYIDPYSTSPASLNMRLTHACLLGFEYGAYQRLLKLKPTEIASAFEAQYLKRVAGACRVVERHYINHLPPTANLHLFLLPFPSVSEFRKSFYGKLGVTP